MLFSGECRKGPRNTEGKGHEANKGMYVGVLGEKNKLWGKARAPLFNQH